MRDSIGSIGFFAWYWQIRQGLAVTDLNVPLCWGVYITNFVFFIGISHAGTLISAILRFAMPNGGVSLPAQPKSSQCWSFFRSREHHCRHGAPDRMLNVLWYPNFSSPLLWDVCSISVYLTASTIYLYFPLIPDIALSGVSTSLR